MFSTHFLYLIVIPKFQHSYFHVDLLPPTNCHHHMLQPLIHVLE